MKLSSTQYFILAGAALVALTTLTILHLAAPDVLIGILVGILYAAAHISGGDTGAAKVVAGINLAVPLSPIPPPAPLPLPALDSVPPLPEAPVAQGATA
jgi:hypothetical protein